MKYSQCCGQASPMAEEVDICPKCGEHTDFYDPDAELQTYLELKLQMREDKQARLKAAGLNWAAFEELEDRVIASIPDEGIKIGKYRAQVETTQTHIIPSDAPLGPTKQRVVLHEERK